MPIVIPDDLMEKFEVIIPEITSEVRKRVEKFQNLQKSMGLPADNIDVRKQVELVLTRWINENPSPGRYDQYVKFMKKHNPGEKILSEEDFTETDEHSLYTTNQIRNYKPCELWEDILKKGLRIGQKVKGLRRKGRTFTIVGFNNQCKLKLKGKASRRRQPTIVDISLYYEPI